MARTDKHTRHAQAQHPRKKPAKREAPRSPLRISCEVS